MSKLLKELTKFFTQHPSALEEFVSSKDIKTHQDVEYWTKYYEFRGL